MEGNTLWQLQALPLDPWEILHTKENMSVQLNIYPARRIQSFVPDSVVCASYLAEKERSKNLRIAVIYQ